MSDNQTSATQKTEKQQRHPSIISGLITLIMKMIMISLLAWFVLIVWLGLEAWFKGLAIALGHADECVNLNLHFIQASPLLFAHYIEHVLLNIHQHFIYGFNALSQFISSFSYAKHIDLSYLGKIENGIQLLFSTTEIILSRLFVFSLALPLFGLILMVFITDGLVKRDIRKFQGARESTFIFHRAKHLMGFCFFFPFFVYLSLPFTITPMLFLMIQGLLLGVAAMLSVTFFKKYV